eukprot:tig00021035_g17253.t1
MYEQWAEVNEEQQRRGGQFDPVELIRASERSAQEIVRLDENPFEILIPPNVSHEEAVEICMERLAQRARSAKGESGALKEYHEARARAMEEFVRRERGSVPGGDIAYDKYKYASKPLVVAPLPNSQWAGYFVPGVSGGGAGSGHGRREDQWSPWGRSQEQQQSGPLPFTRPGFAGYREELGGGPGPSRQPQQQQQQQRGGYQRDPRSSPEDPFGYHVKYYDAYAPEGFDEARYSGNVF